MIGDLDFEQTSFAFAIKKNYALISVREIREVSPVFGLRIRVSHQKGVTVVKYELRDRNHSCEADSGQDG
jgi:hypothetical protein